MDESKALVTLPKVHEVASLGGLTARSLVTLAEYAREVASQSNAIQYAALYWIKHGEDDQGNKGYEQLGFSSWTAFVEDYVSSYPEPSSTSIHEKVKDIECLLALPASWGNIGIALAKVPMAVREIRRQIEAGSTALPASVEEVAPVGPDDDRDPWDRYIQELAELPAGQAIKRVQEDAKLLQIWIQDIVMQNGRLEIWVVMESEKRGYETYRLRLEQLDDEGKPRKMDLVIADFSARQLGKPLQWG